MSKLIGIVGYSSSGKSTSLRNMPAKETFIVTPYKLELPIPGFKSKYKMSSDGKKVGDGNFCICNNISDLPSILKTISTKRPEIKYLVFEDITHYFNAITLGDAFRSKNTGNAAWARWGDFGATVYQSLFNGSEYRDDLTLITMFHPETYMTPEGEKLKIKTPGNLLDREVDIPSYFTNLLYTKVLPTNRTSPTPQSERYKFVTNDDGYSPAKTSYGMFEELYVENDLYAVITQMNKFETLNK